MHAVFDATVGLPIPPSDLILMAAETTADHVGAEKEVLVPICVQSDHFPVPPMKAVPECLAECAALLMVKPGEHLMGRGGEQDRTLIYGVVGEIAYSLIDSGTKDIQRELKAFQPAAKQIVAGTAQPADAYIDGSFIAAIQNEEAAEIMIIEMPLVLANESSKGFAVDQKAGAAAITS